MNNYDDYVLNDYESKLYNQWYNELWNLANKLRPWYDIDKVKDYGVFVWTKDTDAGEGENVFDIEANELVFYTCFNKCNHNHKVIEEAKPVIKEIQKHLKNKYYLKLKK